VHVQGSGWKHAVCGARATHTNTELYDVGGHKVAVPRCAGHQGQM
jgi:hypothetical protein